MPQPIFISYARSTSRVHAEALQAALAATDAPAFLDTKDIEVGARFPQALVDAILAARVFVLFADHRYFRSWYCLREMKLALAEFEARVASGASESAKRVALGHMVVALPPDGLPAEDGRRLPPDLISENAASADATDKLVALVRARATGPTLAERQRAAGVPKQVQAALVSGSLLPPPGNLSGLRIYPLLLPVSRADDFVGRHDELWRLDLLLASGRGDPRSTAAPVVVLHGGPGMGKSQLAVEYVRRFGAGRFPGGLFWVDASGVQNLESQHHAIWQQLDPERHTDTLMELRHRGEEIADLLARALHTQPPNEPILFVLDNVPEAEPGVPPRPLRHWCPAPSGEVAVLATSRRRLDIGASGIEVVQLRMLTPESAVALLTRDVDPSTVEAAVWGQIAEAVGYLPLALYLLNRVIAAGLADVSDLARALVRANVSGVLDKQAELAKEFFAEQPLPGVTEAFQLSFDLLGDEAKNFAVVLAFFAPAPIPEIFLDVLEAETPTPVLRTRLATSAFLTTHYDVALEGSVAVIGQMHRVLASFLRTQAQQRDLQPEIALHVLALSIGTMGGEDPAQWSLLRASLPHLRHALEYVEESGPLRDVDGVNGVLFRQLAGAFEAFGRVNGERAALVESLRVRRLAARTYNADTATLEWAETQLELAAALVLLGDREPGTALATEAEAACRGVLERADRLPAEVRGWAKGELASTLERLGRSAEAVPVWREVIAETDRADDPLAWAASQHNLGVALEASASKGDGQLEAALVAYHAALEERTRQRVPEEWAQTQSNLAEVLYRLAEGDETPKGTERLRDVVLRQRQVLEVLTRERRPRDWGRVQYILADALDLLGQREGNREDRVAAVDAYFAALEELDRDDDPLAWARLQETIADVCRQVVDPEAAADADVELLEHAKNGFESALEVFTREIEPEHWAGLQAVRGEVLMALARAQPGQGHLEAAIEALQGAVEVPSLDEGVRVVVEHLLADARTQRSLPGNARVDD